jgi:hypothetical protein
VTAKNGSAATALEEERIVFDFDALVAEARAKERPAAAFHTQDGTEFEIPSPLDWSDEVLRLQSAAQRTQDPAVVVALCEALLGDRYADFTERGGSAMKLNAVLPKMLGGTVGESSAS